MKLSADPPQAPNLVTGYAPGEVRLATRSLIASAILLPGRIVDWPVAGLATLNEAAVDLILAQDPELVLLATGEQARFVPPVLLARLLSRGVGCEVMSTGAACRTYNVLVGEERRVALALIFG